MSTATPITPASMAAAAERHDDTPEAAEPAAAAKLARRPILGDNPMLAVLGAAVVGLLIFSLTSNMNRIDRLEDAVHAGFAAQNAMIDARFDAQDAKFDARFTALEDRMTALEDRMTALEDRVTALEDRMTALEDRVTALEDRMTALEDRVTALEDRMDRLELKLTALIAALGKAEEVADAVEGRLLAPGSSEASP